MKNWCQFVKWHQFAPHPPVKTKFLRGQITSSPCSSMCFLSNNCTILLTFECPCSLLWTVADKLFNLQRLKLVLAFKNLTNMSSGNVYDFSYKQKVAVWLGVVYPLLFDQNQHCFPLNKSKEDMCSFTSVA